MTDREKVINGLKELSGFLFKEYGKAQAGETSLYYDRFLAVDNALALLKEQGNEYEKGFNDAMLGKQEWMYEGTDGKWHKKEW